MPIRDILIAILVVSIWGFNFTMMKISLGELPPFLVSGLRFFFAAVPVIFFIPRPKAPWALVVGYGLAMACALYALLNLALFMGFPASLASLVLQVQAMFTIGIAFLIFKEVPRRLQLVGALLAFSGIAVIASGRDLGTEAVPLGIILLAAVCWALANNLSKLAGKIPMLPFTVWGNLFGAVALLVLAYIFEGGPELLTYLDPPSWSAVGLIAFLAYPAALFAFYFWSLLLSRYSAATVAPFTLLSPVAGIASGVLILGEPIHLIDVIGGALVFAGLLLTVVRLKQKQAPRIGGV